MSENTDDLPPEDVAQDMSQDMSANEGFMLTGGAAGRAEPTAEGWDEDDALIQARR